MMTKNNKKTANKGDWSEFYAFLKILEKGELFAADKNLDIIHGKTFVFDRIIREEKENGIKIYEIHHPDDEIVVFITDSDGKKLSEIKSSDISGKTKNIFNKIKTGLGSAFSIAEAQNLMDKLLCTKVKADNRKKADVVAVIHDRITSTKVPLGFSVKSMVGEASSLLNASGKTNFIFEVAGFAGDLDEINKISGGSKVRDRLKAIIEQGGNLTFVANSSKTFASNLKKIDTALPKFVARMLYRYFSGDNSSVNHLTESLFKDKILSEFDLSKSDYEYKIKNLLDAAALGMVPGTKWNGLTETHGGYIVVKQNGEVVCYHLYNRDEFSSYLYENTKFESAGTTRHKYGKLYEEDGKLFFKLNLQVRFLK